MKTFDGMPRYKIIDRVTGFEIGLITGDTLEKIKADPGWFEAIYYTDETS